MNELSMKVIILIELYVLFVGLEFIISKWCRELKKNDRWIKIQILIIWIVGQRFEKLNNLYEFRNRSIK